MKNFDHYAVAHDVISRLRQAGHANEAAALKAAIDEGATGTEIFMALRFQLLEVVKRVPLAGDSKTLVSKLLAELEAALE